MGLFGDTVCTETAADTQALRCYLFVRKVRRIGALGCVLDGD
jgi:hypothetical protein